jgi:cyclohexanecarboxylate-CoA ligase
MRAEDPGIAEADTLWGLLERRADLTPERLMFVDEQDDRLTFAGFLARAERVAAGLHGLGIGPATPVSWQLPTRIDTVVLSMALSRLGAVQNPIIAVYREREVGSLLRTTGARWFAIPRIWRGFDYGKMALELRERAGQPFDILDVDAGLPEGDPASLPPPPPSSDGDAVRWLYSTSGTTSDPKAVRHSDRSLIAGGIGIAEAMAPGPDDVGAIPFPYAHIGGPDQLVMILRCGLPTLLLETFVPAEAVALMRQHRVTMTGGSTAHYIALLQEQRKQPEVPLLPDMRVLTGGGAPKPRELYWQVKDELGMEVRHGYGMTECPMIASGAVGDSDEQLAESDGAPVRDCEIRVVDRRGAPVATGVDGDIEVRGPMLARGYTDPALTAEAFLADGFFRTGDRGYLRPDGHIVLTGRGKELIIRKGENISPREIEDVLMAHPKVGAVAVIGLPDLDRGERVCAVVESRPGAEALTLVEMQEACRAAGLMVQKIPEQLEIVDALPRNPTMKVLKRTLVERFGSGPGAQP